MAGYSDLYGPECWFGIWLFLQFEGVISVWFALSSYRNFDAAPGIDALENQYPVCHTEGMPALREYEQT